MEEKGRADKQINSTEKDTKEGEEEVLDEFGFAVPENLEKWFVKFSADEKSKNKKIKAQWDSMIKSNGWNITEDPFARNLPSRKKRKKEQQQQQHLFLIFICLCLFYLRRRTCQGSDVQI